MDLVSDILLKQSLNVFNVLTILWPADFEEDSTASGLCELGDLKTEIEQNREGRTAMHFKLENDGTIIEKQKNYLVRVPVRWPLIILSWELKSCLYFSLED